MSINWNRVAHPNGGTYENPVTVKKESAGRYAVMDFGKKVSIKLCQIQKRTERMRILTFERVEGRYGKIVVFDHDKRDNIPLHHAPKEMRAKAEEFFKTACNL